MTYPPSIHLRPPTVTRGRIYTTQELDREEVASYELTIVAQDTSLQPLSATAQLTISVLDINDNAPQFEMDVFTIEVSEETLLEGSEVITEISVRTYSMILEAVVLRMLTLVGLFL